MKKRKICIVVASRANYGRIKSVLKAIQKHPDLELQLVVAASALLFRFGEVVDIIKQDGFTIDSTAYIIVEGGNPTTMAKSTGLAIIELAGIFERLQPDIVLTVADRFETMATAIASSYMNIPLAHTQGGEVTGSIDESVRHAVTKLAHIHFVSTALSRDRLIKMGENPDTVFMTGCPSLDTIVDIDLDNLSRLDCLDTYSGIGSEIDYYKPYLVVMQHPVTTEFGHGIRQINETLQAIQNIDIQTVCFWPNVDAGSDDVAKGLRTYREEYGLKNLHFFRNMPVEDYAILINNCSCLVGNSSSALREGSFLGVPAVNIGSRQQSRERTENVVDAGHTSQEIERTINKQIKHGKYTPQTLYGDGKSAQKITNILATANISIQKKLTY